jgi:N-sulfoglucosamine sulfohydrolase
MDQAYNIVIVICHDLGQHLGCYGVSGVRSPRIDQFAAASIRFENSFCTAPQCSPSRAALWTGRFPHANGVVGLTHMGFANDLNPGERHLAQILGQAGYETHLFGVQHEARTAERCGYEHIHPVGACAQVAAEFAGFVAQRTTRDRPLFAQVGFVETHRPFPHFDVEPLSPHTVRVPPYLPDIPVVREDLAELEASIASMDRAFGTIVDALGASAIADRTLLIFTADHGLPFPRAKMTLYDPGIQVPLILSLPTVPGGVVHQPMISNVDLLPTLLDLLGLPQPPRLHGRGFHALLIGEDYTPNQAIFAEKTYHTYYDPMRAIRTHRWKLIANFENAPWQETSPDYFVNAKGYPEVSKALDPPVDRQYHPPFELYNLAQDPYEQHDLAQDPGHQPKRDELIRMLFQWMQETQDPLLQGPVAQGAYRQRMADFTRIGQSER